MRNFAGSFLVRLAAGEEAGASASMSLAQALQQSGSSGSLQWARCVPFCFTVKQFTRSSRCDTVNSDVQTYLQTARWNQKQLELDPSTSIPGSLVTRRSEFRADAKTSGVSVLLNVWWLYPRDSPVGDLCDLAKAGG